MIEESKELWPISGLSMADARAQRVWQQEEGGDLAWPKYARHGGGEGCIQPVSSTPSCTSPGSSFIAGLPPPSLATGTHPWSKLFTEWKRKGAHFPEHSQAFPPSPSTGYSCAGSSLPHRQMVTELPTEALSQICDDTPILGHFTVMSLTPN